MPDTPVVQVPASPNDYASLFDFRIGIKRPTGCTLPSPTESASWLRVFDTSQALPSTDRVDYGGRADVNMTPVERQATVSFGAFTVTVAQAAGTCPMRLPAFVVLTSVAGAQTNVPFSAALFGDATGCVANVSSSTPWLSFPSGTSAPFAQGFVTLQAQANGTGSTRTGSLTVNGRAVAVYQLATTTNDCTYGPAFAQAIPAAGGAVPLTVTTGAGCPWSVRSESSFITVVNGSGTGSGQASMVFAPNPGSPRQGWYGVRNGGIVVEQPGVLTCPRRPRPRTRCRPQEGRARST